MYQGQKKVWVTKEIFKNRFYMGFILAVRKRIQQLYIEAKTLLILDNTPGHPEILHSDNKKTVVMFFSVKCGSKDVIQVVKLHCRKCLLKRFVASEGANISAELSKDNLL